MKHCLSILAFIALSAQLASCQNTVASESTILYHINSNVKNDSEDYFKEIYSNWKAYLNANQFIRADNKYWNHDSYPYPDFGYATPLIELRSKFRTRQQIQCSIAGIVPVKNDYYLIKSIFSEKVDSSDLININFILSVYAKKTDNSFKFYSSTQYHKDICENRKVGNINYIIHPQHTFDEKAAIKMNLANSQIAQQFELPPLSFDYVVTNDTRDLGDISGLNFFSFSFQPVASGGMADILNNVIYAGNNSEYYPHELVHLYTRAKSPRRYHRWVDEGIAALIGGSTGYDIEWHWEKLRQFVAENPDYPMDDLSALETDIPNGEFTTDFRYAVGALICQRIIDKEGMEGIFEALEAGRSDEEYFQMLSQKLDVNRSTFDTYVKTEIMKVPPIAEENMDSYKY